MSRKRKTHAKKLVQLRKTPLSHKIWENVLFFRIQYWITVLKNIFRTVTSHSREERPNRNRLRQKSLVLVRNWMRNPKKYNLKFLSQCDKTSSFIRKCRFCLDIWCKNSIKTLHLFLHKLIKYVITATKWTDIEFLTRLLQKVINRRFSWSSIFSSPNSTVH